MTLFRHSSLFVYSGRLPPVLREGLEQSARDDLEGPVFPYSRLKTTLTSLELLLDVVGASNDDVMENAPEMLRLMSSTRRP